jgi:hypothetical protein
LGTHHLKLSFLIHLQCMQHSNVHFSVIDPGWPLNNGICIHK